MGGVVSQKYIKKIQKQCVNLDKIPRSTQSMGGG